MNSPLCSALSGDGGPPAHLTPLKTYVTFQTGKIPGKKPVIPPAQIFMEIPSAINKKLELLSISAPARIHNLILRKINGSSHKLALINPHFSASFVTIFLTNEKGKKLDQNVKKRL